MKITLPRTAAVIIFIVLLTSAGCLGTRTSAVNDTAPPAMLVDYHRSGGIDNADDRLVIFDNGAAIISARSASTEILLNTSDLALISALFNQSGFSQLQTTYSAPHGNKDLMVYTISYRGKTVSAAEGATPSTLKIVIDELNRIVSRADTQKTSYPTIGITP